MKTNRPTITDVALHAQVSIATVSRVLNATAPVDDETAERVRQSIKTLEYIPHAAARTLASRKTNTIGLLLPEISGAFFQPLLSGVETATSEAGYDLMIHTTRNPSTQKLPSRQLAEHNTDGLLVFTGSLDNRELTRLYHNAFPVVLMHQTPPPGINLPVVTIENQTGARDIVNHLIQLHHRRRIVFLQGSVGHEDSVWREKGYCEALKINGIPFDPLLVRRGGFNRDEAHHSLTQLIAENIHFDAVFTGDDEAAVGILLGLRQAGFRLPQDISVVGFDDQIFSASLVPPLTTVRALTEKVGNLAVRQLIRIIHGGTVELRLVLPTEPVIRESCGCSS